MTFTIITDPSFWLVASAAVILSGISKAGLGRGAGGVSVPLLSLVISPVQALAIMLPVLCAIDITGLKAYLGRWDRRIIRIILPAGLAGTALGMLTFRYLNEDWVRLLIGLISLSFLAWSLWPKKSIPAKPGTAQGIFWSTVGGFTSFIAHAGGPPLMVYMLPQRLDKVPFVATTIAYFGVINWAKILPYLWLGLMDWSNLATSLLLLPVAIAGTWLGVWMQSRINRIWFFRVIYALLLLTGGKLVVDGLSALMR